MKIFLTGAAGMVAKGIAPILTASGHEIKAVDMKTPGDCGYTDFSVCNILDYDSLKTAMSSCDTVLHLAAIPRPNLADASEIFRVNCQGTFNIFRAAEENGIKKIVQASSVNVLGYSFGVKEAPIKYFPIDEDHPTFTTDAYSFSKNVAEDIAAYFWRRKNINCISFRIAGVSSIGALPRSERYKAIRQSIIEIMDLPETESRKTIDVMLNEFNKKRNELIFESSQYPKGIHSSEVVLPEMTRRICGLQCNLLAFIDPRDLAQAMIKGIEKDLPGCFNMYLNHTGNCLCIDSARFIKYFFPNVTEIRKPFHSDESLISVDLAKNLLGFKPEFGL